MKFLRVLLSAFLLGQSVFAATCSEPFNVGSDTLLTAFTGACGEMWALQSGSSGNINILAATDNIKDNAGNAPNILSDITPASADYDVGLTVTGAGDCMGPSGRAESGANTSYFVLYNNGASEWRLVERIAGASTTLDTATVSGGAPDPASGAVVILLEIRDADKKVYLNGVEHMSHTATNDIAGPGLAGIKAAGVTSDRGDDWYFADAGVAAVVPAMTLIGVGP